MNTTFLSDVPPLVRGLFALGLIAVGGVGPRPLGTHSRAPAPEPCMNTPVDSAGRSVAVAPGVRLSSRQGDARAEGEFVVHLRFEPHARIAPHWHPRPKRLTVLRGSLTLQLGVDSASNVQLAAGSTVAVPARTVHAEGSTETTEILLCGQGPLITYPATASLSELVGHPQPSARVGPVRPYGFVLRLGVDTVAVERVTPSAHGFVADLIERTPRVIHSRYEVEFDPAGGLRQLQVTRRAPNPANSPELRTALSRSAARDAAAMTYTLRLHRGDSLLFERDTTVRSPIAIWLLYGSAGYEWLFQAVRRAGGDSLAVSTLAPGVPRLGRLVVRRSGPTDFAIPFGPRASFRATMDTAGRLLAFSGRETTIKVELERIERAPDVEALLSQWSAIERARGIARELSPRDSATLELPRGARVLVDYGRPLARGRTILGGVVPFDTVWRTGANTATHLTISAPMLLGAHRLEAGTYTLWTYPTRTNGVMLLVNSQRGVWGTAYDATKDVLRVPLQVIRSEWGPTEQLTIDVVPDEAGGAALSIKWGNLGWRLMLRCVAEGTQVVAC